MRFPPGIFLTDAETKVLLELSRRNLQMTNENAPTLSKLIRLRLASSTFVVQTFNSSGPEFVQIEPAGQDFLVYHKQAQAEKRWNNIRYWITTAIATLALVLSGISIAAQLGLITLLKA